MVMVDKGERGRVVDIINNHDHGGCCFWRYIRRCSHNPVNIAFSIQRDAFSRSEAETHRVWEAFRRGHLAPSNSIPTYGGCEGIRDPSLEDSRLHTLFFISDP